MMLVSGGVLIKTKELEARVSIPEDNNSFLDRLYAVAMEPERFRELVDTWLTLIHTIDEDDAGESLKSLEGHLDRAERILTLVSDNQDILSKPIQERLNADPQVALAIAIDDTVLALNDAAKRTYTISVGDSLSKLPFSEDTTETLRRKIQSIRNSASNDAPVLPSIFQILRETDDSPIIVSLSAHRSVGGSVYVILKSTNFVWPDYLNPIVEKAFGLTQTEAKVMTLFVEGLSPEQIAERRDTSISTVRSQIRALYEKTSTTNQAEFIRLAIGLSAMSLAERDVITGAFQRPGGVTEVAYPLPEHCHLMSLPDGRTLDYVDFGPADGYPVVFFHNEYFGNIWPAQAANLAIKAGFRIIIPARPYYGRSSPSPETAITHELFAEDVQILVEKLDLSDYLALAQTMGGKFMVEHALKFPAGLKAVVSIAPAVPVVDVGDIDGMPKYARFVAKVVFRNKAMLKFVAKSGLFYHNRVGSTQFLKSIVTQSEPDRIVIEDPNNVDAIIRGFEFSGQHGYKSFYYDHKHTVLDNLERYKSLQVPAYFIIGTDDNNNRKLRSEKLKKSGLDIRILEAVGGGEMLLFSHPETIVQTLQEAWEMS